MFLLPEVIKKRGWFFLALFFLSCCQGGGCSSVRFLPGNVRRPPQSVENSLPTEINGFKTKSQEKQLSLAGYHGLQPRELMAGVRFFQYEKHRQDPRQTVRVLHVMPSAQEQLQVLFSDHWDHPLYSESVLSKPGIVGLMSWCFFGRIPAGDMVGLRCENQGKQCRPGVYHNAEKRTGKDINARYSLAISQSKKVSVFRGGMGPDSQRWYRLAMGGGLLLFDKQKYPSLYQQVGKPAYVEHYKSANAKGFVSQGQAGYPHRATPRSAVGILPDQSLVFVNVGEGKYRFDGGATPAQMAIILKKLSAHQAVMFDGGGAPQMVLKSSTGRRVVQTYPEVTRSSNYAYNYAFLTLNTP